MLVCSFDFAVLVAIETKSALALIGKGLFVEAVQSHVVSCLEDCAWVD